MAEHHTAVLMLEVFVEADAKAGPAQHRGKGRLAGLDRLTPQILAAFQRYQDAGWKRGTVSLR